MKTIVAVIVSMFALSCMTEASMAAAAAKKKTREECAALATQRGVGNNRAAQKSRDRFIKQCMEGKVSD